jgi:hypothetical protein
MFEAKLMHQFDHRFSAYKNGTTQELIVPYKADDNTFINPRYWISTTEVRAHLPEQWDRHWLLTWRDICRSTDERTVIAAILPHAGTDFTLRVGFPTLGMVVHQVLLFSNFNTFVFDYCSRQLLGGTHLSDYIMKQLPTLPPSTYTQICQWSPAYTLCEWLAPHVLELTYTAYDLEPFAADCGYTGPPFRWDEERRFLLRCELDAAYFHLYSIGRDDVDYILETFPIVKRKDEQAHGEYRAKRIILDIYDAMQQAMATGTPYHTRLDPPPAHGWTPPEITLEAATGRQGAGASEDTAYVSADVQRRVESMLSQPAFHFDEAE